MVRSFAMLEICFPLSEGLVAAVIASPTEPQILSQKSSMNLELRTRNPVSLEMNVTHVVAQCRC